MVNTYYSGWRVDSNGKRTYSGKEGDRFLTIDEVRNLITKNPDFRVTRATRVMAGSESRFPYVVSYKKKVKVTYSQWETENQTWHIAIYPAENYKG